MKTLVSKISNKSLYVGSDTEIVADGQGFIVNNEVRWPNFNNDLVVYENVTVPTDWDYHKYLFDGSVWTLDPAYEKINNSTER